MKTKVKILSSERYLATGSYYDTETKDTVYFSVKKDVIAGMPGGQDILINKWDSGGELSDESGNTHYKFGGLGIIPRPKPLSITELIKELLNLS